MKDNEFEVVRDLGQNTMDNFGDLDNISSISHQKPQIDDM